MKTIVDKCSDFNTLQNDSVKLRLRGKGSGYKEGPERKESYEELHLCISGKLFSKFQQACYLTEDHLYNIYQDYRNFILVHYNQETKILEIIKKMSESGKKKK